MSLLRHTGLLATVALLAACSAGSASPSLSSPNASVAVATLTPSATSTPVATTAPTPTPIPHQPFRSMLYGYSITSLDWTGTSSTTAWDGTGAPGDGDPEVDVLSGPSAARAWGIGVATTKSVKAFTDEYRATNASVHPCKVTSTKTTTAGGAPAIVDENTCEVFSMVATVVRDGHAYVFFTYGSPSDEAGIRTGFQSLLKVISFE